MRVGIEPPRRQINSFKTFVKEGQVDFDWLARKSRTCKITIICTQVLSFPPPLPLPFLPVA